MADRQLTQEYVRSLFDYDPETGVLTWKERPREHFNSNRSWNSTNSRCAGKPTGQRANSDGYLEVCIDGFLYKAHRVIWLWVHGEEPEEIDHDNGVRADNRLTNLVSATRAVNMKNKGMRKDNRSGVTGVGWHAKDRRWVAHITVSGRLKRLGGFIEKADAIAARRKAELELGFHELHGRRKAHVL